MMERGRKVQSIVPDMRISIPKEGNFVQQNIDPCKRFFSSSFLSPPPCHFMLLDTACVRHCWPQTCLTSARQMTENFDAGKEIHSDDATV